jgi:3-isopropylmalate/(R)-2-methylmalate dehydratase small subunit
MAELSSSPGKTAVSGARVWRVGADIDTDQLAPGHAMKSGIEVIATHCLEAVRPDFAAGVQRGDVLVAGPNFGIGSSREQAAAALVQLGVAAVIAPSFSGLYFRNAFNVGLLLLTCERAQEIQEGERIGFDARAGSITRASGDILATEPIPGFLLDMIEAGGLLAQLQNRYQPRTPS